LVSETTWGKIMQLNEKKGVTSAESSRSVRGLGSVKKCVNKSKWAGGTCSNPHNGIILQGEPHDV